MAASCESKAHEKSEKTSHRAGNKPGKKKKLSKPTLAMRSMRGMNR